MGRPVRKRRRARCRVTRPAKPRGWRRAKRTDGSQSSSGPQEQSKPGEVVGGFILLGAFGLVLWSCGGCVIGLFRGPVAKPVLAAAPIGTAPIASPSESQALPVEAPAAAPSEPSPMLEPAPPEATITAPPVPEAPQPAKAASLPEAAARSAEPQGDESSALRARAKTVADETLAYELAKSEYHGWIELRLARRMEADAPNAEYRGEYREARRMRTLSRERYFDVARIYPGTQAAADAKALIAGKCRQLDQARICRSCQKGLMPTKATTGRLPSSPKRRLCAIRHPRSTPALGHQR